MAFALRKQGFDLQPTGKASKRSKEVCSIAECTKPVKYKGLCSMHAERVRRYGDPHHKHNFFADLSGMTFGRLTAVKRGPNSEAKQTRWECRCECGETTLVAAANLKNGHIKSCGCLRVDTPNRRTHGMSNTRTFKSWVAMRRRCGDPSYHEYHLYGGRGITVCPKWKDDFEAFLADMGVRPANTTLDRFPNNDGDYEPGNCRWATPEQQAQNRRVVAEGIAEMCRSRGIAPVTVYSRLRKGWDFDRALNTPAKPRRKK